MKYLYQKDKKKLAIAVGSSALAAILVVVVLYYSNTPMSKEQQAARQEIGRENEADMREKEEAIKKALVNAGIQAIIHTKVLTVEQGEITVQELYPYTNSSGKTYPVHTFVLVPSGETSYYKRVYAVDTTGIVTKNFTDEKGNKSDITPGMFISAMVMDDPYTAEKIKIPTIVYFDRLPGMDTGIGRVVADDEGDLP